MSVLQTDQKGSVYVNVYVQPRASSNQICGLHGEAVRVRITAPPVDDKANAMVIHFFSKLFKVSRKSINIARGKQSRNKKIVVKGVNAAVIEKILNKAIG